MVEYPTKLRTDDGNCSSVLTKHFISDIQHNHYNKIQALEIAYTPAYALDYLLHLLQNSFEIQPLTQIKFTDTLRDKRVPTSCYIGLSI